jgi:hypothetical protein
MQVPNHKTAGVTLLRRPRIRRPGSTLRAGSRVSTSRSLMGVLETVMTHIFPSFCTRTRALRYSDQLAGKASEVKMPLL